MPEISSKSPSKAARIGAFVLLGIVALIVLAQGSTPPASTTVADEEPAATASADPDSMAPPATPPAADVSALLNGLALGNEFDGWRVVNFFPTNQRVIWIELGKSGKFFSVGVGARGTGNPPPPVQTDLYELGYGMVRPKGASISSDDMTKIALDIAQRIRQREHEVAKPVGL